MPGWQTGDSEGHSLSRALGQWTGPLSQDVLPWMSPWCVPLHLRSGALHMGDRVLSVNGTTLEQAAVEDAVQLLAQSGIVVRMEIVPYHLFSVRPGFNQEGEVWGVTVGCGCGSECVRVCVCVCVRVYVCTYAVCSDYSGMPWQHSLAPSPVLSNGSLNGTQPSISESSDHHLSPTRVTTTCPPPA